MCKYSSLMEMQRIFFKVGSEFLNIIWVSLLLKTSRFICVKHDYAHVGDFCAGDVTELPRG